MMKRYFIAIVLAGITLSAAGQEVKWDSTFRPANYAIRAEQFRSYPHKNTDIVFLGNSITANTDWMELLGEPHARNRGISGDISFGVLERLEEVIEGKPDRIFILIGINDISRNIPDSVILNNYRRIIHRIRAGSPATKIFFQTLLPVNNEFTQFKNHYNKDEHILYVNAGIRKMVDTEKITVVDLYPHFLGEDKKLDKKYTLDGLHLLAAGYKIWASILQQGKYLTQ